MGSLGRSGVACGGVVDIADICLPQRGARQADWSSTLEPQDRCIRSEDRCGVFCFLDAFLAGTSISDDSFE